MSERADIGRLCRMLKEVTDSLEAEVEHSYRGVKDHPAMKRRYDRDMEEVHRARKMLEEFRGK